MTIISSAEKLYIVETINTTLRFYYYFDPVLMECTPISDVFNQTTHYDDLPELSDCLEYKLHADDISSGELRLIETLWNLRASILSSANNDKQ
jgi:hypothetical protein